MLKLVIRNILHKLSDLTNLVRYRTIIFKSRFIEMFGNPISNEMGWPTISLRDATNKIGDGLHGTPKYSVVGDIPFINGNNLNEVILVNDSTKYIDEEEFEKLFISLSKNTILISINGSLGKIAKYHGERIALGKSACFIDLKSDQNRDFIFNLMKMPEFSIYLEKKSTKSTIKNVGLKAIREFKVIQPPKEKQQEFISFASTVDKSKVTAGSIAEYTTNNLLKSSYRHHVG